MFSSEGSFPQFAKLVLVDFVADCHLAFKKRFTSRMSQELLWTFPSKETLQQDQHRKFLNKLQTEHKLVYFSELEFAFCTTLRRKLAGCTSTQSSLFHCKVSASLCSFVHSLHTEQHNKRAFPRRNFSQQLARSYFYENILKWLDNDVVVKNGKLSRTAESFH